jgi:RNA polymerase sigma factor (sigma-70 family)
MVAPVAEAKGLVTDHELVASVRRGDDRAFEKLYERYQRRIAAYVYGMVNDYGRAEDITQEVFISALRRMRETERPIAFKPWIYEIAKNACIDQFRRSRRAEEVSIDADEGLGAVDTAKLHAVDCTPDAAVDTKQTLDNLCGAFGGLSETHHEILVLRELEGLSYREIGERMGLSRPSVESTLFRARRRLTEEYDELVSGERCHRIQGIIVTAGGTSLGARDQRRLQRHIAHCQPCRREARLAGLETGVLARPVREVVAAKVAAFLPFPFFFKGRKNMEAVAANWTGPIATMSEPMVAGWSKAAAAAAILVAGAGAGAVTVSSDSPDRPAVTAGDVKEASPRAKAKTDAKPAAVKRESATPQRAPAAKSKPASSGGSATGAPAVAGAGTGAAAPEPTSPTADPTSLIPKSPPSAPPAENLIPSDEPDPTTKQPPTDLPVQPSGDPGKDLQDTATSVNPSVGGAVGVVRDELSGG